MTIQIWDRLEQGSDAWFAVRRGRVTASTVGRLLSISKPTAIDYTCPACGAADRAPCLSKVKSNGIEGKPIKSVHPERVAVAESVANPPTMVTPSDGDEARGLTALLAAERISGNTDPTYTSADMWRGIDDEPRAREFYESFTGKQVDTVGFMALEGEYGLGYSPDGLVGDDGLIEIKSRRQKNHLLTVLDGRVPVVNMAQIQTGLMVTGRAWCDYISYCGGMRPYIVRVLPDPAWSEAISAAVEQFEVNAAQMIAAYEAATEGVPSTERIEYDDIQIGA